MIIDILSTPKFQSYGEIESNRRFEFNAHSIISIRNGNIKNTVRFI